MKKKYVVMMLAVSMLALSACAKENNTADTCSCTCAGCADCVYKQEAMETQTTVEDAEDVFMQEAVPAAEAVNEESLQQEEAASQTESVTTQQEEQQTVADVPVAELTEGEKAARKEQQANFATAREQLYSMDNSLEKTQKINEIDKQILANNSFDFSTKTIQFLGDSITEGICGAKADNSDYISYVNYVNDYLQFANCMNNGKAGRMFSDYAGEELSFSLNMGNMFNNSADISVIFLGVNDYLTNRENKRYGDYYATESTAGYVGSLRYTMKQLKANYPNQEVFFVTMYNMSKTANSTYTDTTTSPQLAEYLDMLRKVVNDYGYHLIELYDTGFMDCTDSATSNTYTADGLHPADSGNRILGEHIAAELSLYYSQNQ